MSHTVENFTDPQDAALALYLQQNDGNELTDLLVAALDEAFRILEDEAPAETLH